MRKKILISTMVATLLFSSTALYSKELKEEVKVSKSSQLSIDKERTKQKEVFQKASDEIITGFNQTLEAIKALEDKKDDKAKKALKSATKNFNMAFKEAPKLDMVPFSQEIVVNEFLGDSASVQKALTLAETLIVRYDTQAAREVMLPLEDEIIITTEFIPMKIYPMATEEALTALEKGKRESALEILNVSLNTIVSEMVLMPLPLLVAEDLVIAASIMDKTNKKDALALLTLAQDEFKKAIYLGYTKKYRPEYKALEEELKAVKKEIKGKNIVEKLYDKVKESFKSLIDKSRKNIIRDENTTK